MLEHVLEMNAGDAGAVKLDPLLRKSGIVNVAHIEMNADRGTAHVIEKLLKLARAEKEALLRVAVLAADPHTSAPGSLA